MLKLKQDIWLGIHKNLETVIYDKSCQEGIDKKKYVRLYVVKNKKMQEFSIEVKTLLIKPSKITKEKYESQLKNYIKKYTKQVNEYIYAKEKMRKTHCYDCKSAINSVSFSICSKCKGIECSCGACLCDFSPGLYES